MAKFVRVMFGTKSGAKIIKNEEEVLEKDLEGYSDYKDKVKYKMIPFIW